MITTVTADGSKEYEFIEYLKKRAQNSDKNVIPTVQEIIDNVRENGDKAVRDSIIFQPSKRRLRTSRISTKDSSGRAGSPQKTTA